MSEKYFDKDGHELYPIKCEDCQAILGFMSIHDEPPFAIWCDTCADLDEQENMKDLE